MKNIKLSTIAFASLVLVSGVGFGMVATNVIANNQEPEALNKTVIETPTIVSSNTITTTLSPISTEPVEVENVVSYVNYSKEKISDVIRAYAILENCSFKDNSKDEITFFLSEYVMSSIQAGKFTNQELKDEYINFANNFQPPHPTEEDCIETYKEGIELNKYWNEKKNTAYNELFSEAKNRYAPESDDIEEYIQTEIVIPYEHPPLTYSLTPKNLPWFFDKNQVFDSKLIGVEEQNQSTEIIPDNSENVNKMAIIDGEVKIEESVKVKEKEGE